MTYTVTEYVDRQRLQLSGDAGSIKLIDTLTLTGDGAKHVGHPPRSCTDRENPHTATKGSTTVNDYRHTEEVQAPAAALFDYLADVRNLPAYFSAMTSATPADGDAVRFVAEVNGTTEEGEAWFRVDTEQQHLGWGSEGPNDYHGELDVTGDDVTSTVTLTLHTEHAGGAQIDEGIKASLASVKSLVEAGEAPTSS